MTFEEELKLRTEKAEQIINKWLPDYPAYRGCMAEAMRYSVEAGGKRLRPVMLGLMYEAYGGDGDDAGPFMAAMEFIHTSSLIHDDLPALDNDDMRRGKPAVHSRFGEAMGILAGDALLNYAYEVLMNGVVNARDRDCAARAAKIIADKSGLFGMLGGQGLDVECDKGSLKIDSLKTLEDVYVRKTAALIEASLMSGAALAGAGEREIKILEIIGRNTGLAFQIRDDVLDAVSTEEVLGKPVHSDEKNEKATYYSLLGPDASQDLIKKYTDEALRYCGSLNCSSTVLKELIRRLCDRNS